jgi:MFS family permease
MLHGAALYRDVWDHKPPLVHLFNLAVVSTGAPLWGIWLLSVLCVGAAAWLLWTEMRRTFGRLPAAIGIAASSILLAASFKGNLPEEYGLLLQVAAILAFARLAAGRSRHLWIPGVWIGVLGGLAFLLKPTLFGLWLAMMIAGLVMPGTTLSRRQRLQAVLAAVIAGAVVIGVAVAALIAAGIWPDFWSAVIEYNLVYASGGDRWARWSESLGGLGFSGILALGGIALLYVLGSVAWLRRSKRDLHAPVGLALALVAVLDLPIEALLSASSGRLYLQYLTPWFAAVTLLAACVATVWLPDRWTAGARRVAPLVLGTGLIVVVALTAMKISSRRAEAEQVWLAVEAIGQLTEADSTVLVWGAEPQVLALANRQAPSRYAYLYPLLTIGYADADRVTEFADDLQAHPPALVIDTSATNGVIPPMDGDRRLAWTSTDAQYGLPPGFASVFEFLQSNYYRVDSVRAWDVYVPVAR